MILNGKDLADTSFACYFTPNLDILPMIPNYDSNLNALVLNFNTPIAYNQFK